MACPGILQVGLGEHFWIEWLISFKILPEKPLAVDLVDFIEFQSGFRLKGCKRLHRLGGKSTPVDKEQDFFPTPDFMRR